MRFGDTLQRFFSLFCVDRQKEIDTMLADDVETGDNTSFAAPL